MVVWSKDLKKPAKRGARPKKPMSPADEKNISAAWETGKFRRYEDLANERNNGETGDEIGRVLDRLRKREKDSKKNSDDK